MPNESEYITPPVYSTNKYGYSNRPMSAEHAESLINRLANVLADRISLTDNIETHYTPNWRHNDQHKTYSDTLNESGLPDSYDLTSNFSEGKGYPVAHEQSAAERSTPSQRGENNNPAANAKFILNVIDGIAIVNTILNINDIRSPYVSTEDNKNIWRDNLYFADTADGNVWANGLINNAYRAIRKVDESYHEDWSKLNPPYVKEYTDKKMRYQRCVYPHFEQDDPDNPWYQFSKDFYKYYNTISIRNGGAETPFNPYRALVPPECRDYRHDGGDVDKHISIYGFHFDEDFVNNTGYQPSGASIHTAQKMYIQKVIETISPISGQPAVSKDFVKYIKDFVNDAIKPNTNPNADKLHPISSVFDYYLLDYLIQILETEYAMYKTLLDIYIWKPSSQIETREDEIRQFNDAPFYSSTCNGASCVGLCYGSCVNTCNGCGGCTSYCSSTCGGKCTLQCESDCTTTCNVACGTGCGGCDKSCSSECQSTCQNGCASTCNTGCKNNCKSSCSGTCDTGCITSCKNGCKDNCEGACGNECGAGCGDTCTSSGAAPTIIQGNPNVTYGEVHTYTEERVTWQLDGNGGANAIVTRDVVRTTGINNTTYERVGRVNNSTGNTSQWQPNSNTSYTNASQALQQTYANQNRNNPNNDD